MSSAMFLPLKILGCAVVSVALLFVLYVVTRMIYFHKRWRGIAIFSGSLALVGGLILLSNHLGCNFSGIGGPVKKAFPVLIKSIKPMVLLIGFLIFLYYRFTHEIAVYLMRSQILSLKRRKVSVFWGDSGAARLFASDIIEKGNAAFFYLNNREYKTKDKKERLFKEYNAARLRCLFKDFRTALKTVNDGGRHLFFTDDSLSNIMGAQAFILAKKDVEGFGCEIVIRVNSFDEERTVDNWLNKFRSDEFNKRFKIRICNMAFMTAMRYFKTYPMLDGSLDLAASREKKSLRSLIVCMGPVGVEILREMIISSAAPNVDLSVDVVACKLDAAWQGFVSECKSAIATYGIKSVLVDDLEVSAKYQIFDLLEKSMEDTTRNFDRIVIVGRDDVEGRKIAASVVAFFERFKCRCPKIHVYQQAPLGLDAGWEHFGEDDEVCTEDCVMNESLFSAAREAHIRYSLSQNARSDKPNPTDVVRQKAEKEWDTAGWFSRRANLAAASGQENKLRALGFESTKMASISRGEILMRLTDIRTVMYLTEMEHLRWNAFQLLHGISCLDVLSEDGLNFVKEAVRRGDIAVVDKKKDGLKDIKSNQTTRLGRHADIVPFSKLPEVHRTLAQLANPCRQITIADCNCVIKGIKSNGEVELEAGLFDVIQWDVNNVMSIVCLANRD